MRTVSASTPTELTVAKSGSARQNERGFPEPLAPTRRGSGRSRADRAPPHDVGSQQKMCESRAGRRAGRDTARVGAATVTSRGSENPSAVELRGVRAARPARRATERVVWSTAEKCRAPASPAVRRSRRGAGRSAQALVGPLPFAGTIRRPRSPVRAVRKSLQSLRQLSGF